jgi:hypothetical protein
MPSMTDNIFLNYLSIKDNFNTIIKPLLPENKDILASDCIDIIAGMFINSIISKEHLGYDDISLIYDLTSQYACETIGSDLYSLMHEMYHIIRENTNGAVILNKIFVSQDDFNTLINEAGVPETTECKIMGVTIKVNDDMVKLCGYSAVGIGKSKYDSFPVSKLIICGGLISGE